MTAPHPIMRPSDLRKAVSEWCAQGFIVTMAGDGSVTVEPAAQKPQADQFDVLDLRK